MFVEVYETKPIGFKASVEVAACYLEVEGRLLLLECAAKKQEAGRWGVPAGKLEKGETPAMGKSKGESTSGYCVQKYREVLLLRGSR